MKGSSPERQLTGFIAKYPTSIQSLAISALEKMRSRMPGAVEMVYDNYNALVVGFGPNDRASDAVFSIALYPRWINLFFLKGAFLDDPANVLEGAGNLVRRIKVTDVAVLDRPEVVDLIKRALVAADPPIKPSGERRMVVKSVSAKQRPRRR